MSYLLVNGGWSDWVTLPSSDVAASCKPSCHAWSYVDVRKRECNNPEQKGDGQNCQGPSFEGTACRDRPECIDGGAV